MKKLLLALALALGLAAPAKATISYTSMANANYSALSTDTTIIPTVALTATRTLTLAYAGATCIGVAPCPTAMQVIDAQGNVGGTNSCLSIAPSSGDTINGSASAVTFCSTYGRALLQPTSGSNWRFEVYGPGQLQGTTTNDSAQAGYVGEVITSGFCLGTASTATVTITIAAPGVFTDTAHGITGACPVVFTNSGGGLPTGITSGTTYWVVPSSITANTYSVATTVANALAGTAVTTTGSSTGTQTRTSGSTLTTTTAADITGVALTAGDWDCRAVASRTLGASTSVTVLKSGIAATSATLAAQGRDAVTYLQTAANVMGALGQDQHTGPVRISLAATTNEFLSAQDTFTVSTNVAFGALTCRRAR